MADFPIRTPEQIPGLLQALRKGSKLTQAELGAKLGMNQQVMSQTERRADRMNVTRFLQMVQAMGAEVVIRQPAGAAQDTPAADKPVW
jgi:HTH-type transcriptional regulator / antitoxin HipB